MIVTILAVLCIVLLGLITAAGYRAVIRGTGGGSDAPGDRETCTICRRQFPGTEMVERQIGDYRILRFCRECIARLAADVAGLAEHTGPVSGEDRPPLLSPGPPGEPRS